MTHVDLERSAGFVRNKALENLLAELNSALGGAEHRLTLPAAPTLPTIFVVGPPRSGTTLVMQWLAASGRLAWPSNLLSRFYAAPYLGARIQQLLIDPQYNYRNELLSGITDSGFESDLGKTRGLLQPNEFWYFWRRFFPLQWPAPLSNEQRTQVDGTGFVAGLAAIEAAFAKPFAAKALLLQYDLSLLAELLPKSIFLHLQRDPVQNAGSLLRARERFWGDAERWYSARPPGTELLLSRDKYEQVAGQIAYTHTSIEKELAALPHERKLSVQLEDFCGATSSTWSALVKRCEALGYGLPITHAAPTHFPIRASTLSERTKRALSSAFHRVAAH